MNCCGLGFGAGLVDYLVGAAARVGAGLARVWVAWGERRGAEGGAADMIP